MRSRWICAALLFLVVPFTATPAKSGEPWPRPKLVVVLVVDQFRADYLTRFQSHFLPEKDAKGAVGGYRYLMKQSAYFPFAEFDVLQSMTGPGHATVLTGALPYMHGVPINDWFSAKLNDNVYCVEDRRYKTVGAEIKSPHAGTSPANLMGSTYGDELKLAGLPSRIVSIAIKDRAAILMGGHLADLSFWFDDESFHWVSSQYYVKSGVLPAWMQELNKDLDKKRDQIYDWTPVTVKKTPESWPREKIGTLRALSTPFGLEMTELAAEKAISAYNLGHGDGTDMLAISFSTHDYLGHVMGPNTLEMAELTIAEDRVVARLLNKIRTSVAGGLRDVVVVLTADHGIAPHADAFKGAGLDSGRMDPPTLEKEMTKRLEDKFGKSEKPWVVYQTDLNFYLNRETIKKKNLQFADVENVARAYLLEQGGIFNVITGADYEQRRLPPGLLGQQVLNTYIPGVSGDVVGIPKPFHISSKKNVDHMTGYSYDRMVPLILSGWHLKKGIIKSRARVIDLAPTLSYMSGVMAPSGSEGQVLYPALAE